jgi:hypothetical protein
LTRQRTSAALATIAVAAFAAAIVLSAVVRGWGDPAPAQAAGTTPDLYIQVAGLPACTTNNPSDPPNATGDVVCNIPLGEDFVLEGYVGSIAGLPDTDGDPGYAAAQWRLLHSSGLTLTNPAGTDAELGIPGPFWPDCSGVRSDAEAFGQYDISCYTSNDDESTYTGKVIEVRYSCTSPGQNTLNQNDAASYVHNETHGNQPVDKHGEEILTINCLSGVTSTPSHTPTATPSPTPKNPNADTDGDTIANSTDMDDDNDGCPDTREMGFLQNEGGLRNPHVFWDFFDTPDSVNYRDLAVAGPDFFRVLGRFGSSGSTAIDPLSLPPAAPAYHTAFDRGASAGPFVWNLTAPDGAVAGPDFFAILAQFGHDCQPPS